MEHKRLIGSSTARAEIKGFTFYRSYYEAIKELPDDIKTDVVCSILDYVFTGKHSEDSGISKAIFELIKPNIDNNLKKVLAGIIGGKSKARPKQKLSTTKAEAKQKPSETEANNKDKNKNKDKNNIPEIIEERLSSMDKDRVEIYREWFAYKKQRKAYYKTDMGIKKFFTSTEKAFADTAHFKASVDWTIEREWLGIVAKKDQGDMFGNQPKQKSGATTGVGGQQVTEVLA